MDRAVSFVPRILTKTTINAVLFFLSTYSDSVRCERSRTRSLVSRRDCVASANVCVSHVGKLRDQAWSIRSFSRVDFFSLAVKLERLAIRWNQMSGGWYRYRGKPKLPPISSRDVRAREETILPVVVGVSRRARHRRNRFRRATRSSTRPTVIGLSASDGIDRNEISAFATLINTYHSRDIRGNR